MDGYQQPLQLHQGLGEAFQEVCLLRLLPKEGREQQHQEVRGRLEVCMIMKTITGRRLRSETSHQNVVLPTLKQPDDPATLHTPLEERPTHLVLTAHPHIHVCTNLPQKDLLQVFTLHHITLTQQSCTGEAQPLLHLLHRLLPTLVHLMCTMQDCTTLLHPNNRSKFTTTLSPLVQTDTK